MHDPDVAVAAVGYGIRRVPAIVIDAKLAEDVMGRGIDEMTLSDAISKTGPPRTTAMGSSRRCPVWPRRQ